MSAPTYFAIEDGAFVVGGRRIPAEVTTSDDLVGDGYAFYTRQARVLFESGWTLSVVWGTGSYSSNRDASAHKGQALLEESPTAEIAAWCLDGDLREWPDGDTVQGWQTPEQVLALIDEMQTWHTERAAS